MKTRQANFELLRIVAMCMIITMHYLTKGMCLPKMSVDNSVSNYFYWVIYAFSTVAVNVYVLISGYFLIDSDWKISKVVRLWLQVLFYSIIIPLVLGAFGIIQLGELGFGIWQQIFLPVEYEHYWFASSYVMLYLLSPILAVAVKNLDQKKLRDVIIALLIVFCGFKSINPNLIPWDKYGCDLSWFIVLFLIAGYIRLYGISIFNSGKKSFTIYALASVATFVIAMVMSIIVRKTGRLEYYMDMTYCYNYITVLIASIGLFYSFLHMGKGNSRVVKDEKLSNFITKIASYTFGVYLFHENIILREKWSLVLGIDKANGQWWQFFHMIMCIIVVFVVGTFADMIRAGIFNAFGKMKKSSD